MKRRSQKKPIKVGKPPAVSKYAAKQATPYDAYASAQMAFEKIPGNHAPGYLSAAEIRDSLAAKFKVRS